MNSNIIRLLFAGLQQSMSAQDLEWDGGSPCQCTDHECRGSPTAGTGHRSQLQVTQTISSKNNQSSLTKEFLIISLIRICSKWNKMDWISRLIPHSVFRIDSSAWKTDLIQADARLPCDYHGRESAGSVRQKTFIKHTIILVGSCLIYFNSEIMELSKHFNHWAGIDICYRVDLLSMSPHE